MARFLIIANWKMNPRTYREAEGLFLAVRKGMQKNNKVGVVICLPLIWLIDFSRKYKSLVAFGAQNVFWETAGAYTGEVSPQMLKSSGVSHVIIGHSERKIYLGETDEMINKKVKAVFVAGLKPILCIGERERSGREVPSIVGEQLKKALEGVKKDKIRNLIVAYEPVWAISTMPGACPDTPDNAFRAAIFIRKVIADLYGLTAAKAVRVIYGGSVSSANTAVFLKEGKMGGALVGGASLDASEFIEIVKVAGRC